MNLIDTYYAVEICDNGIWRKPANWKIVKKWIPYRVKQLEDEGWEVRVKVIKEYIDEKIIDKQGEFSEQSKL